MTTSQSDQEDQKPKAGLNGDFRATEIPVFLHIREHLVHHVSSPSFKVFLTLLFIHPVFNAL